MTKWIIFILLLLAVGYFVAQKAFMPTNKTLAIGYYTQIQIEIADNLAKQVQGLSGRDSLCENCGMLFVYANPQILRFWMKDMKFPLDIIFIKDQKVSEIFEYVPVPQPGKEIPWVQSSEYTNAVLEVNAGFVSTNRIKISDPVSY